MSFPVRMINIVPRSETFTDAKFLLPKGTQLGFASFLGMVLITAKKNSKMFEHYTIICLGLMFYWLIF